MGFNFLAICENPSREGAKVTLEGIVTNIVFPHFPADVKVFAVVSAALSKATTGKCLDLMAWRLGKNGQRETFGTYIGTPLVLPEETGPTCLPYPIRFSIPSPGIYGFHLLDRDGAFQNPKALLATYVYGVEDLA